VVTGFCVVTGVVAGAVLARGRGWLLPPQAFKSAALKTGVTIRTIFLLFFIVSPIVTDSLIGQKNLRITLRIYMTKNRESSRKTAVFNNKNRAINSNRLRFA
jgi:Na+/alanine symporter